MSVVVISLMNLTRFCFWERKENGNNTDCFFAVCVQSWAIWNANGSTVNRTTLLSRNVS